MDSVHVKLSNQDISLSIAFQQYQPFMRGQYGVKDGVVNCKLYSCGTIIKSVSKMAVAMLCCSVLSNHIR